MTTPLPSTPPEQWGPCRLCKITWKQCREGHYVEGGRRCCDGCGHPAVPR